MKMATISRTELRKKFYEAAWKQLAILKKHPRLPRKQLIPLLADLFTGLLLILQAQEAQVDVATRQEKQKAI